MKQIFIFLLSMYSALAISAPDSIENKTIMCSACHGANGMSSNPEWPNLAGQHAQYLVKQLHDFKAGQKRNAPTMSALVSNLSDQDIQDIANFYARLPLANDKTPDQSRSRGEQIYRGGDFKKHITACITCHGPKGTGNEQAGFPVIAGQHATYTIQQLQAFKSKSRKNDLNAIMQDITARMSPEDMETVANYIAGLHE